MGHTRYVGKSFYLKTEEVQFLCDLYTKPKETHASDTHRRYWDPKIEQSILKEIK